MNPGRANESTEPAYAGKVAAGIYEKHVGVGRFQKRGRLWRQNLHRVLEQSKGRKDLGSSLSGRSQKQQVRHAEPPGLGPCEPGRRRPDFVGSVRVPAFLVLSTRTRMRGYLTMTEPARLPRVRAELVTRDGVRLSAAHDPPRSASTGTVAVLAHGFTGSWQRDAVRAISGVLSERLGVVSFDFRGHGRSSGESSLGDLEIYDVDAAVSWARTLGYERIVTLGFSMGGSVVLRHAALLDGVDAVAAVSSPAFWFYRGTPAMRFLHQIVESGAGRRAAALTRNTRITSREWDPQDLPMSPVESAALLADVDVLIVHGDVDHYFPLEHAYALHEAAQGSADPSTGGRRDLWIEDGYGHAEAAASPELVDRIGQWLARTK